MCRPINCVPPSTKTFITTYPSLHNDFFEPIALGYVNAESEKMAVDRIWLRIKEAARRNGRRKRPLSRADAERVIEGIVAEERIAVPRDAVEYFARELLRLAENARP